MKIQFREGWSSLLLILGILLSVAWSFEAAQWTDGMPLLQWAVIFGVIWGLAGAKSKFPGWFMHASAGLMSLFWTVFLAATLLPERLSWYERVDELRGRYVAWFWKAVLGNTNTDNIIFLMECLLTIFLISYFAAWFAYRKHRTWPVIMPAGIMLVLNIYNAQGSHGVFLFIYLLCALLFAVRAHLTTQEDWWQHARIGYNRLVGVDFLRDGAIFSVVVILFSQALPVAAASTQVQDSLHSLEGPWQGVRDKWGQLFATLNYKPEPNGTGFFGSNLTLGGALHLNNTPIMEARATDARYWEAVAYDKYTGRGWENTDTVSLAMRTPDSRVVDANFALRTPVTQTIKVFYPTAQLFGEPMAVAWSKPIVAQMNRDPNASVGDAAPDSVPPPLISMAYSGVPTRASDEYTVLSLVSKADIRSLRRASTTYPEWVTERYLELPPNVPQRVKLLAERITQGATSNYDKAAMLEAYLRTFTYNEFIQPPPPDRDVVDYFLFTSRQGYCNYYASAMAVMLRELGVPARVASGYARGEYDSDTGVYHIRESDSHTWVEVFFPSYGWIQFEPTASQPTLDRPEGTDPGATTDDSSATDNPGGTAPNPRDRDAMIDELMNADGGGGPAVTLPPLDGPVAGFGYLSIIAIVAIAVGLVAAGVSWQRHIASLTPLEAEFESLQRYARWLGFAPRAAQTPHEFAAGLAAQIPAAATQILRIADLYVRSLFARDALSEAEQQEAKQLWPSLRKRFIAFFLNGVLARFFRPPKREEQEPYVLRRK